MLFGDAMHILSKSKDVVLYFYLSKKMDIINDANVLNLLEKVFETYNINKLDIKRIYRYLDKNIKKDAMIDDIDDE